MLLVTRFDSWKLLLLLQQTLFGCYSIEVLDPPEDVLHLRNNARIPLLFKARLALFLQPDSIVFVYFPY